jgi:hypothetical protein
VGFVRISARVAASVMAAVALYVYSEPASAQELEPRAYSAAPIGTNFLGETFSNSSGQVGLSPDLPVSNVTADIDIASLGFSHSFDLAGRLASLAILIPYVQGTVSGMVFEQSRTIGRAGFSDFSGRLAINLLGNPALTPAQFARRKPATTVGFSQSIIAPTGVYDPTQAINIGSNRWAFKSEVGLEQPIGKAFADFSAGVWFFTENADFYGGQVRSQAPLSTLQAHAGYNFAPGLWLAADGTYYHGGGVRAGGGAELNDLANSRYGFTLAIPATSGFSTKVAWSKWLAGRYGQNFSTLGLTLQYRWFDRR